MKAKKCLARELVPGDFIVTAIGVAPVLAIEPDHGGLAVKVDLADERCTRPQTETSVLWFYHGQEVAFRPGVAPQPVNERRRTARERVKAGSPFLRAPSRVATPSG